MTVVEHTERPDSFLTALARKLISESTSGNGFAVDINEFRVVVEGGDQAKAAYWSGSTLHLPQRVSKFINEVSDEAQRLDRLQRHWPNGPFSAPSQEQEWNIALSNTSLRHTPERIPEFDPSRLEKLSRSSPELSPDDRARFLVRTVGIPEVSNHIWRNLLSAETTDFMQQLFALVSKDPYQHLLPNYLHQLSSILPQAEDRAWVCTLLNQQDVYRFKEGHQNNPKPTEIQARMLDFATAHLTRLLGGAGKAFLEKVLSHTTTSESPELDYQKVALHLIYPASQEGQQAKTPLENWHEVFSQLVQDPNFNILREINRDSAGAITDLLTLCSLPQNELQRSEDALIAALTGHKFEHPELLETQHKRQPEMLVSAVWMTLVKEPLDPLQISYVAFQRAYTRTQGDRIIRGTLHNLVTIVNSPGFPPDYVISGKRQTIVNWLAKCVLEGLFNKVLPASPASVRGSSALPKSYSEQLKDVLQEMGTSGRVIGMHIPRSEYLDTDTMAKVLRKEFPGLVVLETTGETGKELTKTLETRDKALELERDIWEPRYR